MDQIKLDIEDQISKIDQSFTGFWSLYFNGLLSNDMETLEKIHNKVTKDFKSYKVLSILFSTILVTVSIVNYFTILNYINLNKAGVWILFTVVLLTYNYRFYKVKVNLENKIYLLGLLDKIDKK